jgi:hypothetical protein
MQQRATPAMMRLRRSAVEPPFAFLKYRIFGNPRFLLRTLTGAQTEISLGTMAYNLKRMLKVLGGKLGRGLVTPAIPSASRNKKAMSGISEHRF